LLKYLSGMYFALMKVRLYFYSELLQKYYDNKMDGCVSWVTVIHGFDADWQNQAASYWHEF